MSLAYAILAALTDQSASGYDLAKYFDASVGYFWAATHQQIYRELAQLEAKGWVESQTITQEERPNKKLYSLTVLGREQLMVWMQQPSKPSKHKEEILVKLFAGALLKPERLIAELQRCQQSHQQQLAEYQAITQQYFPHPDQLPYAVQCQYLTLRQGICHERNWIAWCEEAIATLATGANEPSPLGGGAGFGIEDERGSSNR